MNNSNYPDNCLLLAEVLHHDFPSLDSAFIQMEFWVDDPCIDNHRWRNNATGENEFVFDSCYDEGCCGFFDIDVMINGVSYTIGCNYGH